MNSAKITRCIILNIKIQDYFECIIKKHNENTDNPSIKIHVNKIENRITFKIKNGYYLELLRPETKKSYFLKYI